MPAVDILKVLLFADEFRIRLTTIQFIALMHNCAPKMRLPVGGSVPPSKTRFLGPTPRSDQRQRSSSC